MYALIRTESAPLGNKNILLVIAHPDDEVMFFGPTLVGITNATSNNNIRVLCLSNGMFLKREVLRVGDADGIGYLREQELIETVGYFGIKDVETLNHKYECARRILITGNCRTV